MNDALVCDAFVTPEYPQRLELSALCLQSGHALAAATEGVPVRHIAAFLALGLPGAYVVLDQDSLTALTPFRILRV